MWSIFHVMFWTVVDVLIFYISSTADMYQDPLQTRQIYRGELERPTSARAAASPSPLTAARPPGPPRLSDPPRHSGRKVPGKPKFCPTVCLVSICVCSDWNSLVCVKSDGRTCSVWKAEPAILTFWPSKWYHPILTLVPNIFVWPVWRHDIKLE